MKKIGFLKIIACILIFAAIMFFPYAFNALFTTFEEKSIITVSIQIDWEHWCDIMAIALPSALTYLVIKQSEQQQKANELAQNRMEKLNLRMQELENKSKIGYFLPYVKESEAGKTNDNRNYQHSLKDKISLINVGEDGVFVVFARVITLENTFTIQYDTPCFFSNKDPNNELLIDLKLSENELKDSQINVRIELEIKSVRGYRYMQILHLGFDNTEGIGELDQLNMEICEVEDNAD